MAMPLSSNFFFAQIHQFIKLYRTCPDASQMREGDLGRGVFDLGGCSAWETEFFGFVGCQIGIFVDGIKWRSDVEFA